MAWLGKARRGGAWQGLFIGPLPVKAGGSLPEGSARHGLAWQGRVWPGGAGPG